MFLISGLNIKQWIIIFCHRVILKVPDVFFYKKDKIIIAWFIIMSQCIISQYIIIYYYIISKTCKNVY